MYYPSLSSLLINRERGSVSNPDRLLSKVHERWHRPLTLKSKQTDPQTTDVITSIEVQEDFMVTLTDQRQVFFHLAEATQPRLCLCASSEIALKFFIVKRWVLLILKRRRERFLRFYAVDLDKAREGKRIRVRLLADSTYSVSSLVQIDAKHGRVVLKQNGEFFVWELLTEKLIFSTNCLDNQSVWYSQDHIIFGDKGYESLSLRLKNLSTQQEQCLSVAGLCQVDWLFKAAAHLCMYDEACGLVAIDLDSMTAVEGTDIKTIAELEMKEDLLLTSPDGTTYFWRSPQLQWHMESDCLLLANSEEVVAVFDGKVLTVVTRGVVRQKILELPSEATAIAINEDTNEVFLACSNGKLFVIE